MFGRKKNPAQILAEGVSNTISAIAAIPMLIILSIFDW